MIKLAADKAPNWFRDWMRRTFRTSITEHLPVMVAYWENLRRVGLALRSEGPERFQETEFPADNRPCRALTGCGRHCTSNKSNSRKLFITFVLHLVHDSPSFPRFEQYPGLHAALPPLTPVPHGQPFLNLQT
jgi:hypothetical protein